MESSPKRRKTSNDGATLAKTDLTFNPQAASQIATASTFVLGAEELLRDVQVDYTKVLGYVDKVLFRLREVIGGIEGHDPLPVGLRRLRLSGSDFRQRTRTNPASKQILEATKKVEKRNGVVIPWPLPPPAPDVPYKFAYAKPSQYNVVGSYVSRTMIKGQPRHAVDMVIEMPKELFQEKDYQKMRYFYRRAYYLGYVAAGVKKELGKEMELTFEYFNDNQFLPVLVLTPIDKSIKGVIRVIPCAPVGLFKKSKLLPSCSCNQRGSQGAPKDQLPGTPFYNSTVKAEETFISYLQVLTLARNECPSFDKACMLGRVWLQQRGFGSAVSSGGFGHFEWSLMIALLMQMGGRKGQAALSSSLSGTALFKAAVQFIASTNFITKPFLFKSYKGGSDAVKESGPVMFDPVRELNILHKMTPWSAVLLQMHAKSTLELLSRPLEDQFEPTFIAKADLPRQLFDALAQVDIDPADVDADLDEDLGFIRGRSTEIYEVLAKALGDRVHLVHMQWDPPTSWATDSAVPRENKPVHVRIGLTFDAVNMSRTMEYGPPVEDKNEAAMFRKFWGSKAELRRFQDGRILECVPWESNDPFSLCREIMNYSIKHQLGRGTNALLPKTGIESLGPPATEITVFNKILDIFREQEKTIRNLEGMPLQIRRFSPISTQAQYARSGSESGAAANVPVLEVVLFFETSNRWPENLVAIQETKLDLLLDLGQRLSEAAGNIETYLGRDNVELGIENLGYLDVVAVAPLTIRIRVHSDMERTLLERQISNITLSPHVRAEAEQALEKFKWQYEILPLHVQVISTFCTRFPALQATINMVKYWFESQMLSSHFSTQLIEVIVLYVFLQPQPYRVPTTVSTGLMQVLLFLSRWDWRDEPLIADYAGHDISASERSAMYKKVEEWRKRDASMKHHVFFVATSHDKSGEAYTRNGPSRMAAMRMTVLAKAAAKLARDSSLKFSVAPLFQRSLGVYDVIFHLSEKELTRLMRLAGSASTEAKQSKFKNLDGMTGVAMQPIAAWPIERFIEVLRDVYDDTLEFFHGDPRNHKKAAIGAVWKPRPGQQKFRVGLPYNFKQADAKADKVVVDRTAILAEIARIGGELIREIEETSAPDVEMQ
ncbi:hypothetical protein jhhlp_005706 [Lomentospora prolificans]|uniref:U3 small nucleolar RNA-associated protein 22 n=1 Tax=Lomentospora prolificans TaxID=41688 RepID=A0A2N3N3V3_9PEZI|nr:hypothetical protein jhhlp_005706 [Lomentospora prolificans]